MSKARLGRLVGIAVWLALAAPTFAQDVTSAVTRPRLDPLPRGQAVIDIATVTRHPASLEPMSLKTPDGVRILHSAASPDNARTCPRGAAAGSECRQLFRVTLDTGARCHAAGDYEALFRINCWPGTAASRCAPGAHRFDFRLGAEPACQL